MAGGFVAGKFPRKSAPEKRAPQGSFSESQRQGKRTPQGMSSFSYRKSGDKGWCSAGIPPPPLRGGPPPFHKGGKGAKLPQSQFRQPKEGGAVSPALSAVSYRFFSRPVASLNSLMSSSSSLAWAWTASQVPLVSYHKSLRSWTSLACCSTQV